MRELVDACNEKAILALYDPARMAMMFVATVEAQHPLRYVVEVNGWVPVYAGASGWAIMAFLPEAERQEIVARTKLAPLTERTISSPLRLEQELERVRCQDYACARAAYPRLGRGSSTNLGAGQAGDRRS